MYIILILILKEYSKKQSIFKPIFFKVSYRQFITVDHRTVLKLEAAVTARPFFISCSTKLYML